MVYTQVKNVLSLKLVSIKRIPCKQPDNGTSRSQLSSVVTHHSGVFTAYSTRERSFSGDKLLRFVKHVSSSKEKS